jgi:hypothetical protein
MENDSIPDAAVSTTECNFGEVRFGVPGNRTITLENIGRVNCRYRFIPKLNETKPCKDWLFMHPALGILAPGEKVNIALTININEHTALPFNLGKEKIEDIIILHLGSVSFFSILSFCFRVRNCSDPKFFIRKWKGLFRISYRKVPTIIIR